MLAWALRYAALAIVFALAVAALQATLLEPQIPASIVAERAQARAPALHRGGTREHVVRAGSNGHFLVEAVVDGVPVEFMVDTGATDIVLTLQDALRLGLRRHELRFDRLYQSANGVVRGAGVTLREVRLGQLSLYDVEASVNEAPLAVSLLGMSFLRRLDGYEFAGDRLILHW